MILSTNILIVIPIKVVTHYILSFLFFLSIWIYINYAVLIYGNRSISAKSYSPSRVSWNWPNQHRFEWWWHSYVLASSILCKCLCLKRFGWPHTSAWSSGRLCAFWFRLRKSIVSGDGESWSGLNLWRLFRCPIRHTTPVFPDWWGG